MKIILNSIVAIFIFLSASEMQAQKYFSRTGEIAFFSESIVENIASKSNSANTVLDYKTGKIQWAVLIKSFEFEKALMQDHFNENYMESSKFPKAKFSGEVLNIKEINLAKDGQYKAKVKGVLEIHGVSKEIETDAFFVVEHSEIIGSSTFKVLVADYDIKIPALVKDNIAKEIEIKIEAKYEVLDKT